MIVGVGWVDRVAGVARLNVEVNQVNNKVYIQMEIAFNLLWDKTV